MCRLTLNVELQVQQQKQQYGSRESSIPRLSSNMSLTPRLHPPSPHSIRLHNCTEGMNYSQDINRTRTQTNNRQTQTNNRQPQHK